MESRAAQKEGGRRRQHVKRRVIPKPDPGSTHSCPSHPRSLPASPTTCSFFMQAGLFLQHRTGLGAHRDVAVSILARNAPVCLQELVFSLPCGCTLEYWLQILFECKYYLVPNNIVLRNQTHGNNKC